jgi:O-antigen/teichoic acid export membrane protein
VLNKSSQPTSAKSALKGIAWSSGGSVVFQIIRIVTQIVLARFILPSEFGLFAVIFSLLNVANYFIENGFSLHYIRKKTLDENDDASLWIINVVFSMVLMLGLIVIAPFLNSIFKERDMIIYFFVASISIIFNGIGSLHRARLTRALMFKELVSYSLISTIIAGVIAIIMAYLGLRVWTLVLYHLMYQGLIMILLMVNGKNIPTLRFSMKFMKESYSFSWKLMASGLLHTLYESTFNVLIAGIYSVTNLGYYSNALRIRDGVAQTTSEAIQKVTYPYLSQIQDQAEAYRESNRKILKYSMMVIAPLIMGLVTVADPLVKFLFNENWYDMIPILQLLSINGLFIPLHRINLNVLTTLGRSDLYLRLEIWKKLFAIACVAVVFYLRLDILILLSVLLLTGAFGYVVNTIYTDKLVQYGLMLQIKDLLPILVSNLVMVGGIMLLHNLTSLNLLLNLILSVLIGVISYTLALLITARSDVMDVLKFMKR